MIVAGVMSGTSADGINVAMVRIRSSPRRRPMRGVPRHEERQRATHPGGKLEFLGHVELEYPAAVRRKILGSMNAASAKVSDLARLNFLLGTLYADAVLAAQKRLRVKADLAGCHGQTLYHQGESATFLAKKLAVTWQAGEAAVVAARAGIPVVSDFRPSDMAAGGKGAPLVPYLDYILYRDTTLGRIAQNIGGIANLTAIPAGAALDGITAFDTGPGNMVMDALTSWLFSCPFDRDGRFAAAGRVLDRIITQFLRGHFFRQRPPKTAGREEFGREFAENFLRACGKVGNDAIATATAFTARSIRDAIARFVLPRGDFSELIVSGGGTRNPTLMAMLANEMRDLGLRLRSSDEFGIPSEAKEAVAFALLAFETWHGRPSNVPSATGARKAAILGKISYP